MCSGWLWSQAVPDTVGIESFRHFGLEDGLPSETVYHLAKDQQGFLWIATDAGVSRYDGRAFDNFTMKDGLGDNEILKIVEDRFGRIWFLPFNGQLSYYKDGVIYNKRNDSLFSGLVNHSPVLISFIDSKDNLWLGTSHNGVIKITQDSIWHLRSTPENPIANSLLVLENENGEIVIGCAACKEDKEIYKGLTILSSRYNSGNNVFIPNKRAASSRSEVYGSRFSGTTSEHIIIDSSGVVTDIVDDLPEASVNRINWDGKNKLWALGENFGALKYIKLPNGKWNLEVVSLLGRNIASIYDGGGNHIWLATLGNGLYKQNPIESHRSDLNLIPGLGDETFFLALESDSIYTFQPETRSSRKILVRQTPLSTKILSAQIGKGKLYLLGKMIIFKEENGMAKIISTLNNTRDKAVLKDFQIFEDQIFLVTSKGAAYLQNDSVHYFWPKTDGSKAGVRVNQILPLEDETFWFGTTMGLYCSVGGKEEFWGEKHPSLGFMIQDIKRDSDGNIWVATNGGGLSIIRPNGKVEIFNTQSGLLSDFVSEITFRKDSVVWLTTKKGLTRIWKNGNPPDSLSMQSYSRSTGLPFDQIDAFVPFGDEFWIKSGEEKASVKIPNDVGTHSPPKTVFSKVSINDSLYPVRANYDLAPYQNNLSFQFHGISLESGENIAWKYRLHAEDPWREISNPLLEFASLSPGKYELSVVSFFKDTKLSSDIATITFQIQRPFHQSATFFLLLGLGIAGIIGFILFRVQQARIKRENLNRRLTQSRLTALRTQMNPHFIFNSLNSIQNFVIANDKKEAFLFLSRFGKLMRRMLDQSDSDYILLEAEVSFLELYIQLEQLRANGHFEFNIEVDDDIDPEMERIPPSLIQPVVENAIWHGVMNKEVPGSILIRFTADEQFLTVQVIDDGIGREAAKTRKSNKPPDHKSKGIAITRERLELLNSGSKQKILMDIIDHEDPTGTEVILKIPRK